MHNFYEDIALQAEKKDLIVSKVQIFKKNKINNKNKQIDLFNPSFAPETWHNEMLSIFGIDHCPAWPDYFGKALRNWLQKNEHQPITAISLFSGGGGLDIAFHDAGFQIVEMVEIDPRFVATLELNTQKGKMLSGATVRCQDIHDYTPPKNVKIDFIIGGPPCQTFSAAGRRAAGVKGTTDPKGNLFQEYVRILKEVQPCGFLFENVYGLIGAEKGLAWKKIHQEFQSAGYTLHWRILDAADYGVPQHRERLFIVGLRNPDQHYLFPSPTHGPDSVSPCKFYNAEEAIKGVLLKENLDNLKINGRWGHLIPEIPCGLNYSFYTKEMGYPKPVFAWRSKFSDFMYKADPEVPVRTLKAQGGLYTGPFSWENRHFSISEIKRLQTFPDEYEIVGKRQVCLQQIGNSVPPQIGRILALSIIHQVFGITLPFPMHYIPKSLQLSFRMRKRSLTEEYAQKAKDAILRKEFARKEQAEKFTANQILYLTDKFDLVDNFQKKGIKMRLKSVFEDAVISLCAKTMDIKEDSVRNTHKFDIIITPKIGATFPVDLKSAVLHGDELNLVVFTTLWKGLEKQIKNIYGLDDLVQLSCYYQYPSKLQAKFDLSMSKKELPLTWRILDSIMQGKGVAKQLPIASFAELWQISIDETLMMFHNLRAIGYEIRNSNTNSQIKNDEFLIPYIFPTLNSRSVQLRKSL